MNDFDKLCNTIKDRSLSAAPDIWDRLKKSAAKRIAEQLIEELNGVPSNCSKLVFEQVTNIPMKGKVA